MRFPYHTELSYPPSIKRPWKRPFTWAAPLPVWRYLSTVQGQHREKRSDLWIYSVSVDGSQCLKFQCTVQDIGLVFLHFSSTCTSVFALWIHLCGLAGGRRGKAVQQYGEVWLSSGIKSYCFYCHIIFHFKIGVEQMFLDSCIQSVGHHTFLTELHCCITWVDGLVITTRGWGTHGVVILTLCMNTLISLLQDFGSSSSSQAP